MENITVILPLHIFNEKVGELLKKSLGSVPSNIPILISSNPTIVNELEEFTKDMGNVKIISNENIPTDFCSLVNNAVGNISTDWFSILEYDDTYEDIWFDNVKLYLYSDKEASVYLPLVDLYDYNRKINNQPRNYCGYANEAPWASSFSNELGYIDNECLQVYFNFNLTGAVFNTEVFKKIGGLKTNIKMSFMYEFMLRLTNLKYKMFVIPKLGYTHYIEREDSLSSNYAKEISNEEGEYWVKVAKEECFYREQREVKPFVKE